MQVITLLPDFGDLTSNVSALSPSELAYGIVAALDSIARDDASKLWTVSLSDLKTLAERHGSW